MHRAQLIWKTITLSAIALAIMSPWHVSPANGESSDSHMVWLPVVMKANANPIHQGIATYYDATGAGACSFDPTPNDLMVAAMNADEYNNSAVCGAYVRVVGPKGTVTVRIVDLCPECKAGHLDLSQEAFARIADLPQGRVSITWQQISPAISGPIAYHYPGGAYDVPPFAAHTVVVHLGRPVRMRQQRNGKIDDHVCPTYHIVVIPAGLGNRCWHTEAIDTLFLGVDPQLLTRTAEAVGADSSRVDVANHFGRHDPRLQAIALALLEETRSLSLGERLYVESLTTQLAVHLLRDYAAQHLPELIESPSLSPELLQRAIAFINDQLGQPLSLSDIAASVYLSPYHFTRLFKQSVGVSPHQYVIAQRVEAAKRLLANGTNDLTIAQVAAEVGFAEASHLARHFKRRVGVSPSEYQRRENRKDVLDNSKNVRDSVG